MNKFSMNMLRKGTKGQQVKVLQLFLGNLVTDGDFGVNTEKAVILFQKTHGLSVDGIVGKQTWNALLSL